MPRGGKRPGAGRKRKWNDLQALAVGMWIECRRGEMAVEAWAAAHEAMRQRPASWVRKTARELAEEERVQDARLLRSLKGQYPHAAESFDAIFRDARLYRELKHAMDSPQTIRERLDRRRDRMPRKSLKPPIGSSEVAIQDAATHFKVSPSTARKALEFYRAARRRLPDRVWAFELPTYPQGLLGHARLSRRGRIERLF